MAVPKETPEQAIARIFFARMEASHPPARPINFGGQDFVEKLVGAARMSAARAVVGFQPEEFEGDPSIVRGHFDAHSHPDTTPDKIKQLMHERLADHHDQTPEARDSRRLLSITFTKMLDAAARHHAHSEHQTLGRPRDPAESREAAKNALDRVIENAAKAARELMKEPRFGPIRPAFERPREEPRARA